MADFNIEVSDDDRISEKRDWIKTIAKIVFCLYLFAQSGILIIVGAIDDTQYESKYFVLFGVAYGLCQIMYVGSQNIYWSNTYERAKHWLRHMVTVFATASLVAFAISFAAFVFEDFSTAPFYMTYFIILLANGAILIVSAIISVLVILLLK